MSTTARIAGIRLSGEKGVDDDQARSLYDRVGATIVSVTEYKVHRRGENDDGQLDVTLQPIRVELVQDGPRGEHLRQFARAVWHLREAQQLELGDNADAPEETVDTAQQRGEALIGEMDAEADRNRERQDRGLPPVTSPWETSEPVAKPEVDEPVAAAEAEPAGV